MLTMLCGAALASPLAPGTPLTGVAVHRDLPETWAVVDAVGRVWRSTDGGGRWEDVLAPSELEEGQDWHPAGVADRLGELGSRGERPAVPLRTDDAEDADDLRALIEDAVDAAEAATADALDALSAEVEDGWLRRAPGVRPRVAFTRSGSLVVTRADGLWIQGEGTSWERVLAEPVTAFCDLGDRYVVGTPRGPRTAPDGGPFGPVDPAPGAVRDLVCAQQAVAAAAEGVFALAEGGWTRQVGPDDATAVRQTATGWVYAAAGRLWTTSSPDEAPSAVHRASGITAIVQLDGDTLLAVGASGSLSSTDGGLRWRRDEGAPRAETHAAAVAGGQVLLATEVGLQVRGPSTRDPVGPPDALDARSWVASTPDPPRPRASRLGGLIPTVDLVGALRRQGGGSVAPELGGQSAGAWWDLGLVFTWVPDRGTGSIPGGFDEVDIVVVNGEAMVDDGRARHLLANRIARQGWETRSRARQAALEVLAARRHTAHYLRGLQGAPLLERVGATLRLAELDARLDVLTGGARAAAEE